MLASAERCVLLSVHRFSCQAALSFFPCSFVAESRFAQAAFQGRRLLQRSTVARDGRDVEAVKDRLLTFGGLVEVRCGRSGERRERILAAEVLARRSPRTATTAIRGSVQVSGLVRACCRSCLDSLGSCRASGTVDSSQHRRLFFLFAARSCTRHPLSRAAPGQLLSRRRSAMPQNSHRRCTTLLQPPSRWSSVLSTNRSASISGGGGPQLFRLDNRIEPTSVPEIARTCRCSRC